ncbi:MAG TPA: DMT family transporter [Gemmatimonadales bacterium]|jgi:transporter family-2 protein
MALILVALLVGLVLPVQAGVNAQLGITLGHPLTTAFVSFLVGTLALAALVLLARVPLPSLRIVLETPSWYWVGGLLGALYIAAAVVLAPRLGATTMIASVVAGQMLASLVLDHFGWVGFAEHHATPSRLAGVILVVAGVLLVRR